MQCALLPSDQAAGQGCVQTLSPATSSAVSYQLPVPRRERLAPVLTCCGWWGGALPFLALGGSTTLSAASRTLLTVLVR